MKFFFAASFFLFCILLYGQHTNIVISDQNEPEEPSIVINPYNTDEIVAGANLRSYYYSSNGGITWAKSLLASPYGVAGDPCVIVDTAGDFYYLHLSNPPSGSWLDRIVCQKSTDGGITWSNGSYMGLSGAKDQDKEWAVVDRKNNYIYTTWTQFDLYGSAANTDSSVILFSRSTDEGKTWSAAKRINKKAGDCIDDDNTVEGAVPAVGTAGEIYVCWTGPLGLMLDKSTDNGQTWLDEDIFVSDMPGGWNYNISGIQRCNGLPVIVCDTTQGPFRNAVYINWTDQRNGSDDTDVWLVKSTDGGLTWSAPKRVNDDPAGKQQFFTWMTIDPVTGYLWFVFYDRRNYSDDYTDVYLAVSKDGGETFINFKISETPFLPYSSIFFGDYTNISAYNNVVRPIWTRLHNASLSVLTAIVDINAVGMDNALPSPYSVEQNYPNPFSNETCFSFKLRKPSSISLRVSDIFGREIAVLINHELYTAGKYIKRFEAAKYNLTPGVYYFSLITDGKIVMKRMILTN